MREWIPKASHCISKGEEKCRYLSEWLGYQVNDISFLGVPGYDKLPSASVICE